MKKILLIAAASMIVKTSFSQVNTSLLMAAIVPGTLSEWDNKTLTYLVSGNPGATLDFVIRTEIRTVSGEAVGSTNLSLARARTISSTNLVLGPSDVMPLEIMSFTGKYKQAISKTGKLPYETYQLCVQLVRPVSFQPIAPPQCRNFTLVAFNLARPIMPFHEMILDLEKARNTITFRWTPVTPTPPSPVRYKLLVFEILPHQTPMQALRSNQPLLVKEVAGTTQFIWQPQLGMTPCCAEDNNAMKKDTTRRTIGPDMEPDAYAFIWTIQTVDANGQPFGDGNINGDAISEPNIFFVDRRPPAIRKGTVPSRTIYMNRMRGNN